MLCKPLFFFLSLLLRCTNSPHFQNPSPFSSLDRTLFLSHRDSAQCRFSEPNTHKKEKKTLFQFSLFRTSEWVRHCQHRTRRSISSEYSSATSPSPSPLTSGRSFSSLLSTPNGPLNVFTKLASYWVCDILFLSLIIFFKRNF